MSEKFEPCTFKEATHVEVGGNVYKIGSNEVRAHWNSDKSEKVGINIVLEQHGATTIRQDLFPILGIKPLKEIKREPREFVHIFRKGSSMSYPSWAENGMFRCVEISEEIE